MGFVRSKGTARHQPTFESGGTTMKLESLDALLVHELRDLYSAEKQIIRALPKMIKAASAPDLQDALQSHLDQTHIHAQRLEQIFEELSVSSNGPKCKGMEGLLEEGGGLLEEKPAPEVADAGLISAAQRVEHYEIAAYGTARTFAQMLGQDTVAQSLEQTLEEEKDADAKLTTIAEGWVNARAMSPELDRKK
jgi:ferritin-like metal-binding protein YciE